MSLNLTPRVKEIFPFEPHFATVAGHKMHYIDEGSGPVVLLLHGNPTWSFYYRNLIADLKSSFRVIAPDHIGCGLSDHPSDKHFKAHDRVNHLDEFIAELGLTSFSLVMHDWGGPIGTSLATRHVEKIERLVYLNTTLTEVESLPYIIKRAHTPFIGPFITKYTMQFLRLMAEFGVVKRLPPEVREGYFLPYQTMQRRTAIWDFVADIPFTTDHPSYTELMSFAEKLPALEKKAPVQIIWGLRDPCFHREMLSKVAKHFPRAQVFEIPDASHLVLEDKPELVIPAIREFLSGRSLDPFLDSFSNSADRESQNVLYSSFKSFANANPNTDAVIEPEYGSYRVTYAHTTYQNLKTLVNQYQRGLHELGLVAGDRVLMLVPPGVDFLALSYAVMGRGAVPVYVDPGIGREKLLRCISDANPDVLIGTPKAHLLRLAGKKLFPRLKFAVSTSELPLVPWRDLAFLKKFSASPLPEVGCGGIAMIAFTSGATGTPKGVIFTNEMVRDELRILSEVFGYEGGSKDLPLLPIFSLFNLALGVSSVFPPLNPSEPLALDPARIVHICNELGIRSSFGSPTLWSKIADYCIRSSSTLASLKRVFMAGAPVPLSLLSRLQGILPNGEAYTPYGATEALPVTYVSAKEILGQNFPKAESGELGTFVGKALPGIELRVIEMNDGPIPTWESARTLDPLQIGEVVVSGRNVSRNYLSRPDANKIAKIVDGPRVWHRMGDLGYLDAAGNLYFCGRKAHKVEWQGRRYCSIPVERIFNNHPKVKRSALVQLSNGEIAVVVEPIPQAFPVTESDKEQFTKELEQLAHSDPITSNFSRFFFHPSFPVDSRHNAKIFRDKLGVWASQQVTADKGALQKAA